MEFLRDLLGVPVSLGCVHDVNQRRCGTQRSLDFSTKCGADQRRNPLLTHSHLDNLIRQCSPDPLGYPAGPEIGRLSAGDLRGTNPANPADRHNAVMLEAWDLLHPAVNRPVKRPVPARQGQRANGSKTQHQQPDGSVGIAEVQRQDRTASAAR